MVIHVMCDIIIALPHPLTTCAHTPFLTHTHTSSFPPFLLSSPSLTLSLPLTLTLTHSYTHFPPSLTHAHTHIQTLTPSTPSPSVPGVRCSSISSATFGHHIVTNSTPKNRIKTMLVMFVINDKRFQLRLFIRL